MTPESRDASRETSSQSEVADELKHDAGRLKDSLGARARQEAESRKGQAAQVAGSASSALETAADSLRENPDAPDWMASALQQAARKIESLASQVDGRSVDQLSHDVSEFARRNPGTFLAASAAAGFAAARVLRAGADKKRHDSEDDRRAQGSRGMYAGDQGWAADENIKPTRGGDFESAYLISDTAPNVGSTGR